MAFKMKRSGMQLRSTTRVAPQLTKYSSPLHQDDAQVEATFPGDQTSEPNTELTEGGKTFRKCCPRYSKTPYTSTVEGCDGYECKFAEEGEYDPCASKKPCGAGKKKQVSADGKTCNCVSDSPGGEVIETGNISQEIDPQQQGILTNREVRMNQRMVDSGARRTQRNIQRANRRIRRAIRKGLPISQQDQDIVSGQSLGSLDDNVNIYRHTRGSRSIYTGMTRGAVQPEASKSRMRNYNDKLQAEVDRLAAEHPNYKDGQLRGANEKESKQIVEDLMAQAKANVQSTFGDPNKSKHYKGEMHYINDRTRKMAERKGLVYDPKQEKYVKPEDVVKTPAKMKAPNITVNVMRPSYKMKGYGKKK
jgi:hypothetical protein|tara:strand:+ start:632 stop:1717 length:1086 start_codon:yes stop_codon:yes gene_type:complete